MIDDVGGGEFRARRAPSPHVHWAPGNHTTPLLRIMAAMMGCALLVGCGEPRLALPEDAAAPSDPGTPTVATVPAPAASPAPALGEIVWAESADLVTNAPHGSVAAYAPEAPRITAFVLANDLPAGATVAADWAYNNTSLDAFSRQIVVPSPTGQTWISFAIDRGADEPWPVGSYEVTISLNGQSARQASVAVAPET